MRSCETDGCDRKHFAKGMCAHHYEKARIYDERALARRRWKQMIYRCTNPSTPAYANYGARGIKVCERWLDFDAYYADTGPRPAGMSLDRIDNDGDYEPSNVRWATPVEQRANRRRDPQAAKTHCPAGHPYSGPNLYATKDGKRACRACKNESARRIRANKRLAQIERATPEGATA